MRFNHPSLITAAVAAATIVCLALASNASAADQFKIVHPFTSAERLRGRLVRDAAGNLYGTASTGTGSFFYGIVFELSPKSDGEWTADTLHVFGPSAFSPTGGLVFDQTGNLYGTTSGPGGALYKLTKNASGTWTFSVPYDFKVLGPSDPYGDLTADTSGNFYGVAQDNLPIERTAGTVFELRHNPNGTWNAPALYTFIADSTLSYPHGALPNGGLVFDKAGNLYGTAWGGGNSGAECDASYGCGVVFKLAPNSAGSWTQTVIYRFSGPDGANPAAGLAIDNGNLYGTASGGGTDGAGTVFKLTLNSGKTWSESIIHDFSGGDDGNGPFGGITLGPDGSLYGTTAYGGCAFSVCNGGCGVVFRLTPTPGGWTEAVLHAFSGYAQAPDAPLLLDNKGDVFGSAQLGNTTNGLIFEITP